MRNGRFGSTRRVISRLTRMECLALGGYAVVSIPVSWDFHVTVRTSLEENLRMIGENHCLLKAGKEVIYDAEHFRRLQKQPDYAL